MIAHPSNRTARLPGEHLPPERLLPLDLYASDVSAIHTVTPC
jgi:hypothetical protein